MERINLISDTITKPSQEMLAYMMQAEVGDDVFRADPTVNALEEKVASMFGKEASLFCPSGTMTNQLAIKTHTQALDELICEKTSHVYQYETGGYSFNSGVAVNLIDGQHGKITAEQVKQAIKPNYDWLPNSRLVVIENSCNKGGGSYYTVDEIKPIRDVCTESSLAFHLDGARLFNVLVETEESTEDVGGLFDSISICISKGLAAPVGSLLMGDSAFIARARKFRKVMGGGMRQAGYLAAACIYALDNNITQLKTDNTNAKAIGQELSSLSYVSGVKPIKTNIVIFSLDVAVDMSTYIKSLEKVNIVASQFGPHEVRFVTHNGFSEGQIDDLMKRLKQIKVN